MSSDCPDWKELLSESPAPTGFWLLREAFTRKLLSHPPADIPISIHAVAGERCASKKDLLREWARALEFSDYFGHNWDAFYECLLELDCEGTGKAIVIAIMNTAQLLHGCEDEFRTFSSILRDAAREYSRPRRYFRDPLPPNVFRVILQSAPEEENSLRARWLNV